MDQPARAAQGVSAGYGDGFALQDGDLALPAGLGAAVIGPNGSGKSTLLKAILRPRPRLRARSG